MYVIYAWFKSYSTILCHVFSKINIPKFQVIEGSARNLVGFKHQSWNPMVKRFLPTP